LNKTTTSRKTQSNNSDSLYSRLEFAIRSILFKYQGSYEETLSDWYLALKLIEPELLHPRQLIEVFDRLSEAQMIRLHKGGRTYADRDDSFFLGAPFTTELTSQGIVQPSEWKI
jgi:hypothetical protein